MGVPLRYNFRNLGQRLGTTLMTCIGIGLTVAVLVTALAMTEGLNSVFAGSGHPLQSLVLRTGCDAELNSTVTDESYRIIRQFPGIALSPTGEPMASPEGLTIVNMPSVDSALGMNVTVRGLLPIGLSMRPTAILKGRMFEAGKREIIVGSGTAKRYAAAAIGQNIRFGRGFWRVVGVFEAGDSAANSEIWADLNQLRGDFETAGGSNSVLIRADSAAAMERLITRIKADQRLNAGVLREKEYYAGMTKSGLPLLGLGFTVAAVMAVGSAFAATNTMYAAVSRRTREIGTLRAIGFGRGAILRSFIIESVMLSLLGGLIGIALAYPLNNFSTGIGNFSTFSEVAFRFKVTPIAIAVGLVFSGLIGFVGGLLPAWNASRRSVVEAMRDA